MKASPIMFFDYICMIGVPVLLLVLAAAALFAAPALMFLILLILIAVGCILYGIIGIREAFVHGRRSYGRGAEGGENRAADGAASSQEAAK